MKDAKKSDCILKNRIPDDDLKNISGGSAIGVICGTVLGATIGGDVGRVVGAAGGFLFGSKSHGMLRFFLDSFENICKGAQVGAVVGTLSGAVIGAYSATGSGVTDKNDNERKAKQLTK